MFVVFNPADYTMDEKTVVVLGCGRGGTSALAGILRLLGVGMPDDTHPLKHESSPIAYRNGSIEIRRTRKNIAAMNEKFAVWGWKSPGDLFSTSLFSGALRNPHYIIVTRSMTDVIASCVKHEKIDAKSIAKDVGSVFDEIGRFLTMNIYPTAAVSYEGVVADPRKMILEIVDWLNLRASDDQINEAVRFISEGGLNYKPIDKHSGIFSENELGRDALSSHTRNYLACTKSFEDAETAYLGACIDAEQVLSHLRGRIAETVITRGNLGPKGAVIARQMMFLPLEQIKAILIDPSLNAALPDLTEEVEIYPDEIDTSPGLTEDNLNNGVFKLGFDMAWNRYSRAAFRREELGKALDEAANKLDYIERLLKYRDLVANGSVAETFSPTPEVDAPDAEVVPAAQV